MQNQGMFTEFHCSSCGAKLITRCIFCNNQEIVKQAFTDEFSPKKILPFKKSKEEFLSILQSNFRNNKYIANELKYNPIINDIKGLYVPFFFSNYDLRVFAQGICQDDLLDSTPMRKVFKIDFEEKALVSIDASSNLDDSLMESLKPFNYNELVDFNPAYLAGFQAELPSESVQIVDSRIDNWINSYCYKSVKKLLPLKYQIEGNHAYDYDRTTEFECVLLPVWFVNIFHNNDKYTFLVNGQTGKVLGDFPESKQSKKKENVLKLLAIVSPIVGVTLFSISTLLFELDKENAIALIMMMVSPMFLFMIFVIPLVAFLLLSAIRKEKKSSQGIKHLYDIPKLT